MTIAPDVFELPLWQSWATYEFRGGYYLEGSSMFLDIEVWLRTRNGRLHRLVRRLKQRENGDRGRSNYRAIVLY